MCSSHQHHSSRASFEQFDTRQSLSGRNVQSHAVFVSFGLLGHPLPVKRHPKPPPTCLSRRPLRTTMATQMYVDFWHHELPGSILNSVSFAEPTGTVATLEKLWVSPADNHSTTSRASVREDEEQVEPVPIPIHRRKWSRGSATEAVPWKPRQIRNTHEARAGI